MLQTPAHVARHAGRPHEHPVELPRPRGAHVQDRREPLRLERLSERIPKRITWAVELLDVGPSNRVLEIGCGGGLALTLLAARAKHVVGIDRSAKQVATARAQNPGTTIERMTLTDAAKRYASRSFDRILAVNVNAFRLDPEGSLPLVVGLLRPAGRLVLAWESPSRELVAVVGEKKSRSTRRGGSRSRRRGGMPAPRDATE